MLKKMFILPNSNRINKTINFMITLWQLKQVLMREERLELC